MPALTIPKKITKGDELVVLPRKEYVELLRVKISPSQKSIKTFKPTADEKRAVDRARKRFVKGDYMTLEQLRHELAIDR